METAMTTKTPRSEKGDDPVPPWVSGAFLPPPPSLSSDECGMDEDLDSTKPAGSVKIHVETIAMGEGCRLL